MRYTGKYSSPLGGIVLETNDTALTGLWFEGQKYFEPAHNTQASDERQPILDAVKKWLDIYFSGKEPDFKIPLCFTGTEFRNEVWQILCTIPYGKTVTYGEIAKKLAQKRNVPHMSAQAVGGAVAHNRISIIVPCHRVIGADNSLTGYAGGVDKKAALLKLESVKGFCNKNLNKKMLTILN